MFKHYYILYDIVELREVEYFQKTIIAFDLDANNNHTVTSVTFKNSPLDDKNIDFCREHNDAQLTSLYDSMAEIEEYNFGGNKRPNQRDFIIDTIEHFKNWYIDQNFNCPISDNIRQQPQRKFKYQEYEELFNRFRSDNNANPDMVKRALNNIAYFKNPSAYLAKARKNAGLTVAELKALPGFTWIDPKGTAKD